MSNNFNEAGSLELLARFDFLDVCLLGETGTGKTHTARLIHNLSPRAKESFIAVNCAELSPSLIESELFGYEKGAFTGAAASKAGKFEAASGGTLFLDEIGELPASLQAKLLKVVEEKSVTRVGGTRPRTVDVRIIFATHRDLSVLREDLRYRIAAHTIHLKPLRYRRDEIVPLAKSFVAEFSRRSGRTLTASDKTLKLLRNLNWFGNVRELRSFVQKACLEALFAAENENRAGEKIELTVEFLSARLAAFIGEQNTKAISDDRNFPPLAPGERMEEYIEKIETHLLKNAMEANKHNQTHAARDLGLSRSGLIKKLRKINH
jgi:transcriptional regulator with GAF, ATPase, and Fis domain